MKKLISIFVLFLATFADDGVIRADNPSPVPPVLDRAPDTRFELDGLFGDRLKAITQDWLLKMPERNPAVLDMFATRDTPPYRNLLPWSGEFAGKYITGGVQVLRLTGDPALKAQLADFISKLIALQASDGYLGPFPANNRLEGKNGVWDAWGHYHIMLGLLLWYEDTGDKKVLDCATKIGDLLCAKFLNSGRHVVDLGNAEMNQSVIHSLCLLYRITHTPKYLDLAVQIVKEFEDPRAGDYLRQALAGKEYYQMPKHRWEGLHSIQGMAELYWLTGDEKYRTAYENIWWSIDKLDRHNNGGFSSKEEAAGDPYNPGPIETCATVAWLALSVDMLRMTGDSRVGDELELSTLNQVVGYENPAGSQNTYNTPMEGVRVTSTKEIGFQKRPGSEEVNCCSANAPRGYGLISGWALMEDASGLILNWYGPSTMTTPVRGTAVTLKQETEYPRDGTVTLSVSPEQPLKFALRLRIPQWSGKTVVTINDQPVADVVPGTYLTLDRTWTKGDVIKIGFDMSLHYWTGEGRLAGRASVYRGPLLLVSDETALDPELKAGATLFDASNVKADVVPTSTDPSAYLLVRLISPSMNEIILHDYGTAEWGVPYSSWLPVLNAPSTPFSKSNSLRSVRP